MHRAKNNLLIRNCYYKKDITRHLLFELNFDFYLCMVAKPYQCSILILADQQGYGP